MSDRDLLKSMIHEIRRLYAVTAEAYDEEEWPISQREEGMADMARIFNDMASRYEGLMNE